MEIQNHITRFLAMLTNTNIHVVVNFGDNDYRTPNTCLRVLFYLKSTVDYNKPVYESIEYTYNDITRLIFDQINTIDMASVDKKGRFTYTTYNGKSFIEIIISDNKIKIK